MVKRNHESCGGFTLIELSIVLVIIGLIVGGVLVGQDLIRAAEVRAQITQIEKYNMAVNTFRGKFNAIPGDMNQQTCTQFGFTTPACSTRGATAQGDGNGQIDGGSYVGGNPVGMNWAQGEGETGMFWEDLSSSVAGNLIEGGFTSAGAGGGSLNASGTYLNNYFPQAKIGRGNYVYVYENGSINYYGIEAISSVVGTGYGNVTGAGTMTVQQAYNIDKKMDDGLPTTGNVQEGYITFLGATLQNDGNPGGGAGYCYDSTALTYQVGTQPSASHCALNFKFQ